MIVYSNAAIHLRIFVKVYEFSEIIYINLHTYIYIHIYKLIFAKGTEEVCFWVLRKKSVTHYITL